jgi:hypothetical protein
VRQQLIANRGRRLHGLNCEGNLSGGGLHSLQLRSANDVAVLQFLAAAELLECDLWGQYCELAKNNKRFREALQEIDEAMPDYVCGDFEDECSHADS